ncbi:hypothetical protein [Solibacillus isronensis]|uniref:hypothetical protein n=1 Tax=Solibacillus isronensis TaxID=412383 RepID=UPI0009A64EBC|nr:hypothetical protein [Solibacillus isronensis]
MVNKVSYEAEHGKSSASFNIDFKSSIEMLKKEKLSIDTDLFKSILDNWIHTCNHKERVYSEITENLLDINLSDNYEDEDLTVFNFNLENMHELGKEKVTELDLWNEFIEKIKDHVKLVEHQKKLFFKVANELDAKQKALGEYISKKTSELEFQSREVEEQISSLGLKITELKNLNNKVKKKSRKMQKDFISILGIFAAILLASFGGLTILSNILNDVNAPLGKIMILGSLCLMAILSILFLLLNSIAKLTGEKLRNCHCKKRECTCSIEKKHPTLFISGIFSIIIILLGAFELLADFQFIRIHLNMGWMIFIFSMLILVISIFSYMYILGYFERKKK